MDASTKQKWLAERRTGLGGTDASAIMGVSRFRTPMQVCLDKWGELPEQPDNDRMRYGRMQEPVIRQWYADTTGRTVTVPDGVVRHSKYPFILGSFDGLTDDGRLLEIAPQINQKLCDLIFFHWLFLDARPPHPSCAGFGLRPCGASSFPGRREPMPGCPAGSTGFRHWKSWPHG